MKNGADILNEVLDYLGIKAPTLAKHLGIKYQRLHNIQTGHTQKISMPLAQAICYAWPDIDINYLATGEGKMVKPHTDEAVVAHPSVYMAPLIGKYAYAGYCRGFGDDEFIESLPKYPFFVDHDPKGQYYAIEVKGDSMDDGTDKSIKEGSIALCRVVSPELYEDAKLHINRWGVFVVVTDDGILIKHIKEHDVEAKTIVLSSLNPAYEDIEMSLSDVKSIMNVVSITHPVVM